MTLRPGTEAPPLDGQDEQGNVVLLPALERYTYLWFNPVFGRYGCKDCQTSLLHEMYPELRMAGCFPFGATFDPPEVNARRNEVHIWRIPIIQIDRETAAAWGALRADDDPWSPHAPASVAYLIDPMGVIMKSYSNVDHRRNAQDVLQRVNEVELTADKRGTK